MGLYGYVRCCFCPSPLLRMVVDAGQVASPCQTPPGGVPVCSLLTSCCAVLYCYTLVHTGTGTVSTSPSVLFGTRNWSLNYNFSFW